MTKIPTGQVDLHDLGKRDAVFVKEVQFGVAFDVAGKRYSAFTINGQWTFLFDDYLAKMTVEELHKKATEVTQ